MRVCVSVCVRVWLALFFMHCTLVHWAGPIVDNHTIPHNLTGTAKVSLPGGESYDGSCGKAAVTAVCPVRPPPSYSSHLLPSSTSGTWVNGKRHGLGVATFPDGSRYQGVWSADVFHGYGRRWNDRGLLQEGLWLTGMQQVFGRQRLPQRGGGFTTYAGGLVSTYWQGSGRCECVCGWPCAGAVSRVRKCPDIARWGCLHRYNDGAVYEGQLQGGQRLGWGFLHQADGVRYTGPFVDHRKEGNGVEKTPTNEVRPNT